MIDNDHNTVPSNPEQTPTVRTLPTTFEQDSIISLMIIVSQDTTSQVHNIPASQKGDDPTSSMALELVNTRRPIFLVLKAI